MPRAAAILVLGLGLSTAAAGEPAEMSPTFFRFRNYADPAHNGQSTLALIWGISSDGTTVFGEYPTPARLVWDQGVLSVEPMADATGEYLHAYRAAAAGGSVIVGERFFSYDHFAATWIDGAIADLPTPLGPNVDSYTLDISDDGSLILGIQGQVALLWIDGDPMPLTELPGAASFRYASAVSRDGTILVGSNDQNEAVRYKDGVLENLGTIPGAGSTVGGATDVSDDGSVVVGASRGAPSGYHAFRWEDGDMQPLVSFGGAYDSSEATGVSGDGALVVGWGIRDTGVEDAFLWESQHGRIRLKDLLPHAYGIDVGDLQFEKALGVSSDGNVVVGWVDEPPSGSRGSEGFIAVLPPSCNDGLDNDGDGAIDHPEDPGCDSPEDRYEISLLLPCNDAIDNDGDGLVDLDDAGCRDALWPSESPQCSDGLNNDPGADALIDFDGGASAGLPPEEQTAPDPQCSGYPWAKREAAGRACGLGFELVLVLIPLTRRLRRAGAAADCTCRG
jgi:probable HAF family extracellular repeat protein